MNDTVIKVYNLGKKYRIGETIRHDTLRDAITDFCTKPFKRHRTQDFGHRTNENDTIWALKNVSFKVKRGEVVGIIGKNGAGKTTLLKILSRITEPTEGYAEISGRVGSLLEVGTGFHQELTGRENIFLNGAVLGMSRKEIKRKFDEIVSFAEFEKFIDTPVKRYSSGMRVRLAFAVAAHLEPKILLVDEVLAVGDVEFQKKCLGKMDDVAKEGRTIFFVSHNMAAISNLCKRTLLFDSGKLDIDGKTDYAIGKYLNEDLVDGAIVSVEEIERKVQYVNNVNFYLRVVEVVLSDENRSLKNSFYSDENIKVSITYECLKSVKDLRVIVQVVNEDNKPILTTQNLDDVTHLDDFFKQNAGLYKSFCIIPANTFGERKFYISIQLIYPKIEHLYLNKIFGFDVKFKGYNNVQYGSFKNSFLRPQLEWETEVINEGGISYK